MDSDVEFVLSAVTTCLPKLAGRILRADKRTRTSSPYTIPKRRMQWDHFLYYYYFFCVCRGLVCSGRLLSVDNVSLFVISDVQYFILPLIAFGSYIV